MAAAVVPDQPVRDHGRLAARQHCVSTPAWLGSNFCRAQRDRVLGYGLSDCRERNHLAESVVPGFHLHVAGGCVCHLSVADRSGCAELKTPDNARPAAIGQRVSDLCRQLRHLLLRVSASEPGVRACLPDRLRSSTSVLSHWQASCDVCSLGISREDSVHGAGLYCILLVECRVP